MLKQKPFLSMLTFLGFQVNAAIEEGYGHKILFSDIYEGLEERNLFEILNAKLPGILELIRKQNLKLPFALSSDESMSHKSLLHLARCTTHNPYSNAEID
jgi:hypothetical protein